MAYMTLNKQLEPVRFGKRECVPVLDAETKLRISQIQKYDAKTNDILASAFPKDEEYVRAFLDEMSILDIQELHAYLVGGARMVEAIRAKMQNVINESLDEATQGGEKVDE